MFFFQLPYLPEYLTEMGDYKMLNKSFGVRLLWQIFVTSVLVMSPVSSWDSPLLDVIDMMMMMMIVMVTIMLVLLLLLYHEVVTK